jgi:uncharacterized protein YggT (Ycf19 family)
LWAVLSLIDFILNLAGLLLWVKWRHLGFALKDRPARVSLLIVLRPMQPRRADRHFLLLGLAVLLGLRSLGYWHVGSAVNWMPSLHLGIVVVPFRSDYLSRMALFSLLSFGKVLLVFYLWLFLFSALNQNLADGDWVQNQIRLHLGRFERWPAVLKLFSPLIIVALCWGLLNPALAQLGLLPAPRSLVHWGQQALLVGAAAFLTWKFPVALLLLGHLLSSYVFLGNWPLLNFVSATAHNLLRPLRWLPLRIGKLDLAPLVGIALVIALCEFGARGLIRLYQQWLE